MPREITAMRRLSPSISQAIGTPPAVDGNVLRCIARLRADDAPIDLPAVKKRVQRELEEIYPTDCPGEFTQALMELGATVCVPNGEPKCGICPCRSFCAGQTKWRELPVKLPKKAKKQENRTVFLLRCGEKWAIEKRPARGLLAGLWQFPNESGHLTAEEAVRWAEARGLHPRNVERSIDRPHIFTNIPGICGDGSWRWTRPPGATPG